MKVEIATSLTPAIVDAVDKLVPQLSRSNPPPSEVELGEVVASPATDLFIALGDDGTIIGMSTLAVFRIPTGLRAWIEDVVVDEAAGRRGIGTALTQAMLDHARERGRPQVSRRCGGRSGRRWSRGG
jgi:GNAT superfamily N-acetyltransferase